jgi:hypothetical protein
VTRKEIRAKGRKRSKVRGTARGNEEIRSRRWDRGAKLKLGKRKRSQWETGTRGEEVEPREGKRREGEKKA